MTETPETSTEPRTCRYPGCDQPAAPGTEGPGRPPEYCVDTAHNRANAWRARRGAQNDQGPAVEAEPATMARARAGLLVERLEAVVATLPGLTAGVLRELRTLGDVEAVEAEQIARAGEREAQDLAAVLEHELAAARTQVTELLDRAGTAEAAAVIVESMVEARDRDLTAAHEQITALTERAVTAEAHAAGLTTELAEAHRAAIRQAEEIAARDERLTALAQELADQRIATSRAEARLEDATAALATAREQVTARDAQVAAALAQHAKAEAQWAGTRAQLDAERTAAVRAVEAAEAHAAEMRQVLEERVAELQARLAATPPPTKG